MTVELINVSWKRLYDLNLKIRSIANRLLDMSHVSYHMWHTSYEMTLSENIGTFDIVDTLPRRSMKLERVQMTKKTYSL